MILKLIRFYKNEHATDGILTLQGKRLCNTAEHTPCCLKKGKYPIMISTYTLMEAKNFEWPMAHNQEEAELIAHAEEKAAKAERQEGGEYLPLPAITRKMPCLYPSVECQQPSAGNLSPSEECLQPSTECLQPIGCLRFGNGIFTLADASIIVGERQASGLCIKTREVFDKLYNRIRKCLGTGEKVALVVEDCIDWTALQKYQTLADFSAETEDLDEGDLIEKDSIEKDLTEEDETEEDETEEDETEDF